MQPTMAPTCTQASWLDDPPPCPRREPEEEVVAWAGLSLQTKEKRFATWVSSVYADEREELLAWADHASIPLPRPLPPAEAEQHCFSAGLMARVLIEKQLTCKCRWYFDR